MAPFAPRISSTATGRRSIRSRRSAVDWLEEFFPFLREIDQGSGALEIALVVLVIAIIGVIGITAVRRARSGAREVAETREPDRQGDDGDVA